MQAMYMNKNKNLMKNYKKQTIVISNYQIKYQKFFLNQNHIFYKYKKHLQKDQFTDQPVNINNNIKIGDLLKIKESDLAKKRENYIQKQLDYQLIQNRWDFISDQIISLSDIEIKDGVIQQLMPRKKGWLMVISLIINTSIFTICPIIILFSQILVIQNNTSINLVYLIFQELGEILLNNFIFVGIILLYLIYVQIFKIRSHFTINNLNILGQTNYTIGNTHLIVMLRKQKFMMWIDLSICFVLMLTLNQIYLDEFQSAFIQFYFPLRQIEGIGEYLDIIMPGIVLLAALLYLFFNLKNLIQHLIQDENEKMVLNKKKMDKFNQGKEYFFQEYNQILIKNSGAQFQYLEISSKQDSEKSLIEFKIKGVSNKEELIQTQIQSSYNMPGISQHYFDNSINDNPMQKIDRNNYEEISQEDQIQIETISYEIQYKKGILWKKRIIIINNTGIQILSDMKSSQNSIQFLFSNTKLIKKDPVQKTISFITNNETHVIQLEDQQKYSKCLNVIQNYILLQKINDI